MNGSKNKKNAHFAWRGRESFSLGIWRRKAKILKAEKAFDLFN